MSEPRAVPLAVLFGLETAGDPAGMPVETTPPPPDPAALIEQAAADGYAAGLAAGRAEVAALGSALDRLTLPRPDPAELTALALRLARAALEVELETVPTSLAALVPAACEAGGTLMAHPDTLALMAPLLAGRPMLAARADPQLAPGLVVHDAPDGTLRADSLDRRIEAVRRSLLPAAEGV